VVSISFSIESAYEDPAKLFLGVVGSLFLINISHAMCTLADGKIKDVLYQIGYYSMTRYLFHTLFVSTVRIGFLQVFKNLQVPFELIAFLAIICGVACPLMLERGGRSYWITRKGILGLPK